MLIPEIFYWFKHVISFKHIVLTAPVVHSLLYYDNVFNGKTWFKHVFVLGHAKVKR